jgi:hypothetical protein
MPSVEITKAASAEAAPAIIEHEAPLKLDLTDHRRGGTH